MTKASTYIQWKQIMIICRINLRRKGTSQYSSPLRKKHLERSLVHVEMQPFQPSCMLHYSIPGRVTHLVFLGHTQATEDTTMPNAIRLFHCLRSPNSISALPTLPFLYRRRKQKSIKACLRTRRTGTAWEKGDSCLIFNFRNWKTSPPCVSFPTAPVNLWKLQAPSRSHLPVLFRCPSFPSCPITVQLFGTQDALTQLVSSTFNSLHCVYPTVPLG